MAKPFYPDEKQDQSLKANKTSSPSAFAKKAENSPVEKADLSAIAASLKGIQSQMKQQSTEPPASNKTAPHDPLKANNPFAAYYRATEQSPQSFSQKHSLHRSDFTEESHTADKFLHSSKTTDTLKRGAKSYQNSQALKELFKNKKPATRENAKESPLQMLYNEIMQAMPKTADKSEASPLPSDSFKAEGAKFTSPPAQNGNAINPTQQAFEQKLDDLDTLIMTNYRDRQIKHKHLIEFLEKNQTLLAEIDQGIAQLLAAQKGYQNFSHFEGVFFDKLLEVMARSEQVAAERSYLQLQSLAEGLASAEDIAQVFAALQQDYNIRFEQLEEKINFLTEQQILQQKLHAQTLSTSQEQGSYQNYQIQEGLATTSDWKPCRAAQEAEEDQANYQENPTSTAKTRSFHELVAEQNTVQPNVPKSWQDALEVLFQQPADKQPFDNNQHHAFSPDASARIIERMRRRQVG